MKRPPRDKRASHRQLLPLTGPS
ncbi:hypothetical protein E2C01_077106 [Portunus trituberculatus]|uniref:Uncharacterized protein n=1 Tax=Portunus trituberculatus TaxID=210409 RepID=A0A5B7INP8_PORTR|nr:hypothetical protein [Portunus trituberculatus]